MMMRNYIFLILLGAMGFISCEDDFQSAVVVTGPVSFSKEVNPILTEDCATPSCHVAGGTAPDLSASMAYDQLTQLGLVDTTDAESSILYKRLIDTQKPMPPSGKLPDSEIALILAWIEQGAQNN